jgi:pyrroline-5-carboxylate reductase
VVSLAAGVRTATIEQILGDAVPVVRAMPNTPCAIACGMTVLALGARAGGTHLALAKRIFEPLGRVAELEEKHMDTVTGLSASGPAFVYVMIEALADGGVARGLPRQVAIEMAAQMVFGAASMVLRSGRHPAALKDDVTTPAGCTIAGILALEDGRIRSVLSRAVEVASLRAGELGGDRDDARPLRPAGGA